MTRPGRVLASVAHWNTRSELEHTSPGNGVASGQIGWARALPLSCRVLPGILNLHCRSVMQRPHFFRCLLVALLAIAGCDDATDPVEAVDESSLTFLQVAEDAPPVTDTVVTFWASRTEDREVQIRYISEGYVGKCMRFRVPAGSLKGQDSVKITIRLVDRKHFNFQFEPAGLQFDPANPAQLEVRYKWADPDLNADGVFNEVDEALARSFGFWRQERVGDPWIRVKTQRSETDLEAITPVTEFTRYALATS